MDNTNKIPPATNSLLNLLASSDPVGSLEGQIPESHRMMLRRMGVNGSDNQLSIGYAPARGRETPPVKRIGVGDEVVTLGGKRMVVLKCSVGREKDGTPIHKVVRRKTGDIINLSEKKLRR